MFWPMVFVVILVVYFYHRHKKKQLFLSSQEMIKTLSDEDKVELLRQLREIREAQQADIRESNAYEQRRREFNEFMSQYEKRN